MTDQRHLSTVRLLALGLLLLTAPWAATAAQEPTGDGGEEEGQELFIDQVNVNVVNVDVYVTDRDGKPVTGLTKDDFEIYEDDRLVGVTNFLAIEKGRPLRPEAQPLPAPAEGEAAVAPPAPAEEPVSPEQRLNLVVYIDNFNLRPFQRNRVMRELRDFLRQNIDAQDRVALVSYDRELHVRQDWTSDPRIISTRLLELETVSAQAVHQVSDRDDALERIEDSRSISEALSYARTYAGSIYNDVLFTIGALREYVDGLAGLPGRKAILYVSEGLPMIAGQDLFYAVQQKFGQTTSLTGAFEFDASRRFRALISAANANRVTFYTIDAGGLRTYRYADVSQARPGQGAFIDQVHISNIQSPLQQMAEDTGGRAIINTNRALPQLAAVAQDFDYYYSLGYTPAHYGDGRYYHIEVKLKDGDRRVKVRHREGYRDKPVETRMADNVVSALLHRLEVNPLGLQMGFGESEPAERNLRFIPLRVGIPIANVALLPAADEMREARLKFFVAVMDDEGDMSEVQEDRVPLRIPEADLDQALGQLYLYTFKLLMRPGPHRVAIGLRDEVAGEASYITKTVEVR